MARTEDDEVGTGAEELRVKKCAFQQMDKMMKDEGPDDELDAQEDRRRQRHSRFFCQTCPRTKPADHRLVLDRSLSTQVETPRRLQQQAERGIVKATQSVRAKERAVSVPVADADADVVGDGDGDGDVNDDLDFVRETPISKRGSANITHKRVSKDSATNMSSHSTTKITKDAAPLVSGKRLLNDPVPPTPLLATKKSKKEASFKLRPEPEQIFKGLSFYFIPDNAIAPARRLRINKAREFGAVWTRNITEATHIVVDKSITYNDIQGALSKASDYTQGARSKGSQNSVKIVNEDYPIDCVQFKALLETDQVKYRLTGQPGAVAATNDSGNDNEAPQSSEASVAPLQLKPPQRDPRKWDHVPPRGTPERSGEQSTPATVDSQPIILDKEIEQVASIVQEPETPREKDELSAFISMMQEFKDLPLDKDDEEEEAQPEGPTVLEQDEESERDESPQKKRVATSRRRVSKPALGIEDGFSCHRAGEKNSAQGNPNARTIEILQKMLDYYLRVSDQWRSMAYRRAIAQLKRQQTKISTEEEALQLPGVGGRLAKKIEEIVETDSLQRLEYAEMDESDATLQLFLGIYGVGPKLAHQWINQGHKTLDDLKAKVKLTPSQVVGIERYDDLNTRIPRREVGLLGDIVKKAAKEINPQVELIIGGSYRRGAASSGDIDFIVTRRGTTVASELHSFLQKLVVRLEHDNFLVQRLASMRSTSSDGSIWHGCCVLPETPGVNVSDDGAYKPVWRRIDFLLVPYSQMGGALIYFTGDDIFNRSMRLLARKKGMRLNQRGLYKRGLDGPGTVEDDLIEGSDERKIFGVLGVKWRPPEERWC